MSTHEKCPVCGAEPSLVTYEFGSRSTTYTVWCGKAYVGDCSYKGTAQYATEESAYTSWDVWAREFNKEVTR